MRMPFLNRPVSIGIIDDEQASIDNIKGLLLHIYKEQTLSILEANDFHKAVTIFNLEKVDILFLDITLGAKSGFDILDKLGADVAHNIIIVSASETHAYRTFNYAGVRHYLLKPITINEIRIAIDKCILSEENNTVMIAQNVPASEYHGDQESLVIPNRNGFQIIKINQISYLEANGSYCNIFLTDGTKITHSRNMKFVSAQLPEHTGFIRVHKSYIVNKTLIQAYDSLNGQLILDGGMKISVTMSVKELLEYLQQ
ncbi:MAG: response regulator transcription factor [Taibaiella sp.]|nr:response regulator transcription factor [Taibaiella sp.]